MAYFARRSDPKSELVHLNLQKIRLATLENEGQNTNGRTMIILQPQLTLTTAASAPKTPLATRRKDVTRDPLDARERVTYTI